MRVLDANLHGAYSNSSGGPVWRHIWKLTYMIPDSLEATIAVPKKDLKTCNCRRPNGCPPFGSSRNLPGDSKDKRCQRGSDIIVLISVIAVVFSALISPKKCKDRYIKCFMGNKISKDECEFKRLKCIVFHCNGNARKGRRGLGTYLSKMFTCCTKYGVPADMLHLLN
ncbi:hypothetical protein ScPMuIL_010299 [Solemya velum]